MAVTWVPRLVAFLGLLTFIYSLTRPWVTFQAEVLRIDYRPWSLLEQMAHGRADILDRMAKLVELTPEGERLISIFALHVAFLVVAFILSFLSIIGNSVGGYAATAVFSVLSVALLVYLAEQIHPVKYTMGSGTLLNVGSAFIYVLGSVIARSLR